MKFVKVYTDNDTVIENLAQQIDEVNINTEKIIEPKSETRGRHKLDCECEKCKLKKGQTQNADTKEKINPVKKETAKSNVIVEETDFNKIVSEYETYKPENVVGANNQPIQQQQGFKILISGYVFLMCLDAIIPRAFIKIFKIFNKKAQKLDVKKIKLTKEQLKSLEPMADQVAQHLFGNMPPLPALIVSMSFMYVGNIMTEMDE